MKRTIIVLFVTLLACALACVFVYATEGTDSQDNVNYGTGAGYSLETDGTGERASDNTFIGREAGYSDTTGDGNTGVGRGALRALTTGKGNIALGMFAGSSLTTDNHKLYITTGYYPAYGIFGDFSTGYFGVNTTSPSAAFDVVGDFELTGAMSHVGDLTVTGKITAAGDTVIIVPSAYSIPDDSSFVMTLVNGNPYLGFFATDDDATNITVNTSDQILFQNASGGYVFDNELISTGTIDVKSSPYSDATDSTLIIDIASGEPIIYFKASDDDASEITVNTSDQLIFQNASGGYAFDDNIVLKNNEYIGNGTDGKIDVTADSLRVNGIVVVDSLTNDGGAITIAGGGISVEGDITFVNGETISNGTNGKVDVIADSLEVSGIVVADSVVTESAFTVGADSAHINTWMFGQMIARDQADANDLTIPATASGKLYVVRPTSAKRTYTLPEASMGLYYDFFVADADSLLITTASGDSIIADTGSAYKTQTTVAGTVRLIAIDAVRWVMMFATGTWTGY